MLYRHVQRSAGLWVMMLALAALFAVCGAFFLWPLALVAPLMLLTGWLFHSLTIEIDDRELRWQFGPGLIRKCIPLREITSAQPVRTNVLEGWGIHFSRFGILYNVSGFDAVAITLRNGKRFALGTDEPDALTRAISRPAQPA